MRDGKARLGRGIESLTPTNALPAVQGSLSYTLYDDIEDAAFIANKWESTTVSGPSQFTAPNVRVVGGSKRATSGNSVSAGGYISTPAAAAGSTYDDGGGNISVLYQFLHVDSGLAAVGTWQFDIYTETSALNTTHVRFGFMGGSGGGYIFEASGSNMTTWKLIKNSNSLTATSTTGDTTILTCAGVVGGSATAITVKITRDVSGNFEIFEGGVSRGTVTDTTYTAGGRLCFSTYLGINGSGASTSTTTVDNVYIPGQSTSITGLSGKLVNYYNKLYTCWESGGTPFAFTVLKTGSQASNIPGITHQVANDIAVWQRDGSPTGVVNTYLASVQGATLRCYNAETQVVTASTTAFGNCVFPINSRTIVVIGTSGALGSGIPILEIIKFDAEAWTITSQTVLTLDGSTSGRVSSYAALDSDGALYFVTNDMSANQGTIPSRIFYVNATDLLATAPTITASYQLTDFVARGVFSLQGVIHIFGARRRGSESFAAIMKFDGTAVYESSKSINLSDVAAEQNLYNHGIATVWRNLDHYLFLSQTDLALWDPVLQINSSGLIREVACFNSGQFATALPNVLAIAEWGGSFYCVNAQGGTIQRTKTTRGALGSSFDYATLEMSSAGANTDLINKTLYSVTVELSAAVPAGETLSVLVNDTVVGTMVAASGTRKEIVLSAELTATKFVCKLRWPQASTWTGYIGSGPLLKYVPSQFKKRAWGFGIRATKRLKLGDGSHETRTPATMFSDIEAAWASNTPLSFIDVDGVTYSVIVTDFKQKRPLLQMDRLSEAEAFYFLELLEA